jgi:hypothetical protein
MAYFSLAEHRLSSTQKEVLVESARVLNFHEKSVTGLADIVSQRTGIPYSTVKWNLKTLVRLRLLLGGDMDQKGKSAKLTDTGAALADYFDEEQ